MPDRADSHIHLFEGGFHGSFAGRSGVKLDEHELYQSLAREHSVRRALVVGYTAEPWCAENNRWIAIQARRFPWACPLAYFDPSRPPAIEELENLRGNGFVGLSTYVFDPAASEAIGRLPAEILEWINERKWILSVNSRGGYWTAWRRALDRFGDLRVLVSHLGLPERRADASPLREELSTVLDLSVYPGPRVKLSGFYALSAPPSDYPHRSVWPYVEALAERFGMNRLVWGSDFTPSLDHISFPQTYGLFGYMPFLSESARGEIEGGNLLSLLDDIKL